jgi:hypothetical protein
VLTTTARSWGLGQPPQRLALAISY